MTKKRAAGTATATAKKTASAKPATARNSVTTLRAIADRPHLPPLDEDPNTSMATSLAMHLMSEHGVSEALMMPETDQQSLHERLHRESVTGHPAGDLRFRPGAAFDLLESAQRRHEAARRHEQMIQRLINVPTQKTRL